MSSSDKRDSMLSHIIDVASEAYGDGLVQEAFDSGDSPGDTLALFIARELGDACSGQETMVDCLQEGIRMLATARDEIEGVLDGLKGRLVEAERNGE